jgi:hypothetical protein
MGRHTPAPIAGRASLTGRTPAAPPTALRRRISDSEDDGPESGEEVVVIDDDSDAGSEAGSGTADEEGDDRGSVSSAPPGVDFGFNVGDGGSGGDAAGAGGARESRKARASAAKQAARDEKAARAAERKERRKAKKVAKKERAAAAASVVLSDVLARRAAAAGGGGGGGGGCGGAPAVDLRNATLASLLEAAGDDGAGGVVNVDHVLLQADSIRQVGGRYFSAEDAEDPVAALAAARRRHIKCFKCQRNGHTAVQCPNAAVTSCFVCAQTGHEARDCPMGDVCYVCDGTGHIAFHCPHAAGVTADAMDAPTGLPSGYGRRLAMLLGPAEAAETRWRRPRQAAVRRGAAAALPSAQVLAIHFCLLCGEQHAGVSSGPAACPYAAADLSLLHCAVCGVRGHAHCAANLEWHARNGAAVTGAAGGDGLPHWRKEAVTPFARMLMAASVAATGGGAEGGKAAAGGGGVVAAGHTLQIGDLHLPLTAFVPQHMLNRFPALAGAFSARGSRGMDDAYGLVVGDRAPGTGVTAGTSTQATYPTSLMCANCGSHSHTEAACSRPKDAVIDTAAIPRGDFAAIGGSGEGAGGWDRGRPLHVAVGGARRAVINTGSATPPPPPPPGMEGDEDHDRHAPWRGRASMGPTVGGGGGRAGGDRTRFNPLAGAVGATASALVGYKRPRPAGGDAGADVEGGGDSDEAAFSPNPHARGYPARRVVYTPAPAAAPDPRAVPAKRDGTSAPPYAGVGSSGGSLLGAPSSGRQSAADVWAAAGRAAGAVVRPATSLLPTPSPPAPAPSPAPAASRTRVPLSLTPSTGVDSAATGQPPSKRARVSAEGAGGAGHPRSGPSTAAAAAAGARSPHVGSAVDGGAPAAGEKQQRGRRGRRGQRGPSAGDEG